MPETSLTAQFAAKWQPSSGRPGGTVTDPIWADVVVAAFVVLALVTVVVLALVTVAVVLDSVFRVLQRRAQQNRAMRQWRRDAEQARWERTGLL